MSVTTAAPHLPAQVAPPAFSLSRTLGTSATTDVVALGVFADGGPRLAEPVQAWADQLGLDLSGALALLQVTGEAGQVVRHATGHSAAPLLLLVGLGAGSVTDYRRAGAALARTAKGLAALSTSITDGVDDAAFAAFVTGAVLGSFEFHWRSTGPAQQPVGQIVLVDAAEREAQLARAEAIAVASWRARFWCTTPSNLKNPQWLADQAQELADQAGLEVTVWDESDLARDGFGGLLAVGAASSTPPRLIRIDYRPGKGVTKVKGHIALVGKGITFDTGGLSIKPGDSMVNMKRDMTGGAVVLATMLALAQVGCPVRVTGLIAAAENAIDGTAYRPGDVITHFGGRTTEVTNTDAEGRLVLADALAYAVAEVKPDAVLDIATLTGAMKVALGLRTGGYFANNEPLAELIAAAAERSGEKLWRMPLAAEYEEKLSSKVADADNAAGGPGAITAALFLQHFTQKVPWAHLDIASVGDALEDYDLWTKGPTGFGARALLHWLETENPLEGIR
ncbi:leucyl aminopeptidase [Nocardioides sp. Bht2]|uniref:leucyl aminopeptidase n=1 Tax=Nocardioides sp. Bht2 TaxID=3392297 RepID=UPI0039B65F6B